MQGRIVSPFVSFIIQFFFGLVTVGGIGGFVATWRHWQLSAEKGDNPGIMLVFLILTGSLVAVGVRGIFFARRGLENDPEIRQLSLRPPSQNLVVGFAVLALGVGLTVLSHLRPDYFGGEQYTFYGAMIVGSVMALVGASQYAFRHRRATIRDGIDEA